MEETVVGMIHVDNSLLKSMGEKVKSSKEGVWKKQITLCVV